MPTPELEITQVLIKAQHGDTSANRQLWNYVYDELKRRAHNVLLGERTGQTYTTRALVHEAYFKLVDLERIDWRSRNHFFALSSKVMRQILIDRARYQQAQKRISPADKVRLDDALTMAERQSADILALDEALQRLGEHDEQLVQVVECRFFGGYSVKETADILGVSPRTVNRYWDKAKAYLYHSLRMDEEPD